MRASITRVGHKILILLLFTLAPMNVFATPSEPQPNIVILFADDLGWGDLGAYGNLYIKTPSIDRMAREGQLWTDFYVPSPVCSPSRGALLTGKQPVRSGLYGQVIPVLFPDDRLGGMPESETTLAEALRELGYSTGIFGKWHLGDDPAFFPTRHGFDDWFGIPYSNDMKFEGRAGIDDLIALQMSGQTDAVQAAYQALLASFMAPDFHDYAVPLWRSSCRGNVCEDKLVEQPLEQPNFTQRLTTEAVNFIETHQEKPFFLYLAYSMPHLPIFASDDFSGKSLSGPYGDVIEEIDWSVGEIMKALEALDLDEQTLLIFSSDNGPWRQANTHFSGSAGPLRGEKQQVYEGGVRVPGIFWWPETILPQKTHEIGSVMDLYATAITLAGGAVPEDIDGHDLSATLLQGAKGANDELAFYRKGELRAFRKGRYKIHFYAQPEGGPRLETPQLYDLSRDIGEHENIAERHPAIVAELTAASDRYALQIPVRPPIFDRRLSKQTGSPP
ncbi:MAG: sulfatase [Halieaceae bacterium]|jgi:uncharacterized sulfatase|nr:sulfatase [Halieaceae bacterium]